MSEQNFIQFIREGASGPPSTSKGYKSSGILSAADAKQFYDEVLKSTPVSIETVKLPKKTKRKKPIRALPNESIFRAAQENNIQVVQSLIDSKIDVNIKDNFGWTALMCASCEGSDEVVKLLVKAGADLDITDRSGYNALRLAKKNCHKNSVFFLENYKEILHREKEREKIPKENPSYYCVVCKESFAATKLEHEASTAHLLETYTGRSRTFYRIPETNKGFRLLLDQGWDRERGLGPHGSGRKFPIKAELKADRGGIGNTVVVKKKSELSITRTARRRKQLSEREFRREFW